MPRRHPDPDVGAFDERAVRYESGWLGTLHRDIVDRTIDVALAAVQSPQHVLDVGCGTGQLLRLLAGRLPGAKDLTGVDAAAGMIAVAERSAHAADKRLRYLMGTAEHLPFPDAGFDLVVSTTSFDHWADQQAGLNECGRVLAPGGSLVLADLISPLLLPTLALRRHRGRARTPRRVERLLNAAGFRQVRWHHVYQLVINAAEATRS